MKIAYGNSRMEKKWKNRDITWEEFCKRVSSPAVTTETVEEYKKMGKKQQDDIKDVGGFVGGHLREGRRKSGTVLCSSMLTLDMDYGTEGVVDELEMLFGYQICIYSTHKHTPDEPRLRLIIPLSREISEEEYPAVGRMVAKEIGIDMFDDTTYQPQRLMYWPSVSMNGELVFKELEGEEELTEQLKMVCKQLYHQEQQKRRLGEILDNLDILADDYDETYDKTQAEIDGVYDEIERLELLLSQTKKKLESVEQEAKALKQVESLIQNIPKFFEKMTCEEKRKLYQLLIEKIEMYPEETSDGRVVKSISFKIPVFYEDWEPTTELMADEVITYTLDTSEVGITSVEAKATYVELKKYILDKYGTKVSSLYIAQIKRKYGIDMGENYNKPDDPNKRVPKCPKAKEKVIIEALKHFKMLGPDVEMMA